MSKGSSQRIAEALDKFQQEIVDDWIKEQFAATSARRDLMNEARLAEQSREFLATFRTAAQSYNFTDIEATEWSKPRALLGEISRSRAEQGYTPAETATFVFSLKQPLFTIMRRLSGKDYEALAEDVWTITVVLDKLGLYTTEVYQKTREAVIKRQQEELTELSTPVVKLWEGVLLVPLIGTLDSARTGHVMSALLEQIAQTGSAFAILDITGVPSVDTQTAQHLLKTVAATRLMGADCIISGVRPVIAQTIVTLGLTLDVITKSSIADALAEAIKRLGYTIARS
ncbi:MAG: STAS domain-containing protein [Phycisphaerales bacterium]|nr:MAG: STAS domain-containing protein [Phycisphaerales bacterium]